MSMKGTYFTVVKHIFIQCTNFMLNGQSRQPDFTFESPYLYLNKKINNIRKEVKCTWDMVLRKTTTAFSDKF